MAAETASSVVRSLLSTDINLSADQVIEQAKAKGVKSTTESLRGLVYNIRSELRKKAKKGAATQTTAARQTTPKPKPRAPQAAAPQAAPAAAAASPDLAAVLSNVLLVNRVVGLVGSTEGARQVADAVRSCGGVEAFLQHLELVSGLRAGTSE